MVAIPWKRWARRSMMIMLTSLAVGLCVGWSGAQILSPQRTLPAARTFTYVKATEGTIGETLNLNVRARWTPRPVGTNRAIGTLTTIRLKNGSTAGQGDVLYEVDAKPVSVAEGAIPAYRDIEPGDQGADVEQLQMLLADRQLYSGSLDGKVSNATVAAVKRWQASMSVEPSGIVRLGDILFVPKLPTRLALDPATMTGGAILSGGESAVQALPSSPKFDIPVTSDQAAQITEDMRVQITSKDKIWKAKVSGQSADPGTGDALILLEGIDDRPICRSDCAKVPLGSDTLLPAEIETVKSAAGVVIPAAALATKADGNLVVIDKSGQEHPVKVVQSSSGMTLVTGITSGLNVRTPAE